jgi:hypothetical protein
LPNKSTAEFIRDLRLFLPDLESAVRVLDAMQKKGTMPAYPQQQLAHGIAMALYLDTGEFPPMTNGKTFSKVLVCALDTGDTRMGKKRMGKIGIGRQNVRPLMRIAKDNFDPGGAKELAVTFDAIVAKTRSEMT